MSALALASASDRSDSEREEGTREDSAPEEPPRLVTPLPGLHSHHKEVAPPGFAAFTISTSEEADMQEQVLFVLNCNPEDENGLL